MTFTRCRPRCPLASGEPFCCVAQMEPIVYDCDPVNTTCPVLNKFSVFVSVCSKDNDLAVAQGGETFPNSQARRPHVALAYEAILKPTRPSAPCCLINQLSAAPSGVINPRPFPHIISNSGTGHPQSSLHSHRLRTCFAAARGLLTSKTKPKDYALFPPLRDTVKNSSTSHSSRLRESVTSRHQQCARIDCGFASAEGYFAKADGIYFYNQDDDGTRKVQCGSVHRHRSSVSAVGPEGRGWSRVLDVVERGP